MRLAARIRRLLHRRFFERDLEEELRIHRDMAQEQLARQGLSPAEARHAAQRTFGNTTRTLEDSRSVWTFGWLETLLQDLRYAARGFGRSPGFVLTVVATIALGLGLNTALFTLFNAYVLRPIAVRDPYSLYQLTWTTREEKGIPLKWGDFQRIRKEAPAVSDVAARQPLAARVDDKPVFGELVTGNFFSMVGIGIAQGRALGPDDAAAPGAQPVLVLSHTAWKNKFGANPNILGQKLVIRGYPFEVVGVASPGFTGFGGVPIDFWAPITMSDRVMPGPGLFDPAQPSNLPGGVIGRIKPGWDPEHARGALLAWGQQFTSERPDNEKAAGVFLRSRASNIEFSLELITVFSPIIVAFALVFIAACANVANMMLARALSRQREIGIRLSLGAARGRLIRQLLTESILLALPSAAAGFAISQATLRFGQDRLFATLPSEFVKYITILPLPLDLRVFAFMLTAAFGAALLFGLAPAAQATRPGVVQAARGDFSSEFRPSRLRNSLVITQIAICALLLIVAGVLLRGGKRIENLDVGLEARGVIQIEVTQPLREAALRHLASEPLVEAVSAAGRAPFYGLHYTLSIKEGDTTVRMPFNPVSPGYYDTFAIPIVSGRNFTLEEARDGAAVAILSQTAARRLFPGTEPVGGSIRLLADPQQARYPRQPRHHSARVVGIARDAVYGMAAKGKEVPVVFFPIDPSAAGTMLLVRVKGDPESARQRLSARLDAAVPGAVDRMNSMDQALAVSLYPFRMAYWMSCAVGGLALVLTLSGVYGVLSYLVSQRTREIGIRMALGAAPAAVIAMVLRQLVRMAVIGITIGAVLALGVARLFSVHLVLFNLYDSLAYLSAAVFVFLASMGAAYVPSRRAALIDPVTTLRSD